MRIAVVADQAVTVNGWSRDPKTLTEGLLALGHHVSLMSVAPTVDTDGSLPASPALASGDLVDQAAQPQAVLSLGLSAPCVAAVIAESLGVPLVVAVPPELFAVSSPSVGYGRLLCRHLPCALLIVETERQAATVARLGGNPHRIAVVPPGLRVEEFTAGRRPSSDHLHLLFDATRTSPPDQQFLKHVLDELTAERRRHFHTTILCAAAEAHALWQERPQTTLTDLSFCRNVPKVYLDTDIVVVPSATSDETIPVLRAMAAGRAIIAAECPAIRDMLGTTRTGILARAETADEWVDKLNYLFDSPALQLHIGRGARLRAETHFSLSQTLRQLAGRLEAVAANWRYIADQSEH